MIQGVRGLGWLCLLAGLGLAGSATAGIWQDLEAPAGVAARSAGTEPRYYRGLQADEPMLRQSLAAAPLESTSSKGAILELPLPNGTSQAFEVVRSPILSPQLAAKYPQIKTYRVTGIDDPAISGRLDMTPAGFHAMLATPAGTVFIDPDTEGNYRSFYKQDYAEAHPEGASEHVCHMDELDQTAAQNPLTQHMGELLAQRAVSTNTRRTYKLAVVTTGEYGHYFGSESAATNAVVTTINRVNQIYGRDLAVQLQLTKVIVYTSASGDPFDDPTDLLAILEKNQDVLDYAVGLDNYDIGHVFGTTGGGVAMLNAVCSDLRAMGYTGHPTPNVGDPYDIDFVAHEMGHQLSATHSFNGTTDYCGGGNRSAGTAAEPGSGTTIMAYAGICGGENLQANSDATFHAVSIGQINAFINNRSTGGSCGTLVSTSNSLPATIDAGSNHTIPQGTPFVLTGSVSADPDGDTLSYQWDQIDVNGTETSSATIGDDLEDNPLFRSFVPKSTPTRYFPRLSTLISGVPDIGERLPSTARTLSFRMTVRDGSSGVGDDDLTLVVSSSMGPFRITGGVLNDTNNLLGGSTQTLTWDPAGTETSCPTVSISLLSISGDSATYCDKDDDATLELMTGVSNNGSASVTLPSVQLSRARVVVSCENNVFFALSDNDFSITSATTPIANDCKSVDGDALEHGTVFVGSTVASGSGGGGGGGALYLMPLALLLGAGLRRLVRGMG